jgi:hypothetical protein
MKIQTKRVSAQKVGQMLTRFTTSLTKPNLPKLQALNYLLLIGFLESNQCKVLNVFINRIVTAFTANPLNRTD